MPSAWWGKAARRSAEPVADLGRQSLDKVGGTELSTQEVVDVETFEGLVLAHGLSEPLGDAVRHTVFEAQPQVLDLALPEARPGLGFGVDPVDRHRTVDSDEVADPCQPDPQVDVDHVVEIFVQPSHPFPAVPADRGAGLPDPAPPPGPPQRVLFGRAGARRFAPEGVALPVDVVHQPQVDRRIGVGGVALAPSTEGAGKEGVITVDPCYEFPVRPSHGLVDRVGLPAVGFGNPAINAIGVALDDGCRPVVAAPVDDQVLEVWISLVDHRADGPFDEFPLVVGRGHHGDPGEAGHGADWIPRSPIATSADAWTRSGSGLASSPWSLPLLRWKGEARANGMSTSRVLSWWQTARDLARKAGPGRLMAEGVRNLGHRRPVIGVEETAIAHRAFCAAGITKGTLVDVGAFGGGALAPYLEDGWEVHAFEPDDRNRKALLDRFGDRENLRVVPKALSERPQEGAAFFISQEYPGISSLTAFDSTHEKRLAVEVTTLDLYSRELGLAHVDAIKVDAEGYDLFVLRGAPPDLLGAKMVICEFEDAKTLPLGYASGDLKRFLTGKGFEIYTSEWYPIVRYGSRHIWRRFLGPDRGEPDPEGWGNFIAVRSRGLSRALTRELCLTARGLR